MDIKDERKECKCFKDLVPGDVFAFEDVIYMRVETIKYGINENNYSNAVSVKDGTFFKFEEDEFIIPLVVQLRIIRNE